MKHIINYKKFESNIDESIEEIIKDILIPISDLGYEISVDNNTIRIVRYTDNPLFITNEVKDSLDRLYYYFESIKLNSGNILKFIVYYVDIDGNKQLKSEYLDFIKEVKSVSNLLLFVQLKLK